MKTLPTLLKALKRYKLFGSEERLITSVEFDSREIKQPAAPNESQLFVAQRGTQIDGHCFIPQAIAQGARVIVCETLPDEPDSEITYIQVTNSAIALGNLAAAFYDYPSRKLKLVGITGTNGKTTTVTLLYHLFTNLGHKVGLFSTISNRIGEEEIAATHTTPDAVELNRLLARMTEVGCTYCFMEVSSHAIFQHRIAGLHFSGGIFSNITHDHMDFHRTFARYLAAKKAFFDHLPRTAFALTNADDKNGLVMVQNCRARISTYSLSTTATFKGTMLENSFHGLQMRINGREVFFKLCGKFNACNLLAIYGTAVLLGAPEDEILLQMSRLESAAGRFEMLHRQDGATAIVDYAHTPDALQKVLTAIRDITKNETEIITVVGCGGDRDTQKRPEMASIACHYSNRVILTSDNPRTEEPTAIIKDMLDGVPKTKKKDLLVIENRREAIKVGCRLLPATGVLLVAGKGHETSQEINHVRHHFSDREEIINFFKA